MTKAPSHAPDREAYVEISFDAAVPTAINGVSMRLAEVLESLSTIAGDHGVGSRATDDAPSILVLLAAYRELRERDSSVICVKLFKGACTIVGLAQSVQGQ